MASYQKKYLNLKEASVISGYTAAELRNFCKIGLVPSRKVKSKLFIRFDAFEKLNDQKSQKTSTVSKTVPKAVTTPTVTSLLPFTTPSRHLVKTLQPVAFAAALVMVLHIVSLPAASENVVGAVMFTADTVDFMADSTQELVAGSYDMVAAGLSVSADTLAYMGNSTAELMAVSSESVAVTLSVSADTLVFMSNSTESLMATSYELAASTAQSVASLPAPFAAKAVSVPQVAGVTTQNLERAQSASLASVDSETDLENLLIGIADGSDQMENYLVDLSNTAFSSLINALRFESLDEGIQQTFKW